MGVDALTDQDRAMTVTLPTTIGLGRLVDLVIRDAQGQRLRLKPHCEQWLAWKPDTRDLVVLRPGRGEGVAAKMHDARRHHRFHGADPEQARPMEWPAARGAVHTLGLIESVTYVATGIRSPSKGRHHWIHQFGDDGSLGHGPIYRRHRHRTYPDRFLPVLTADEGGSLFIVRRPGNVFTVRDWIWS